MISGKYFWLILILSLFTTTFGLTFCLILTISFYLFLAGAVTIVYLRQTKSFEEYLNYKISDFPEHVYKTAEQIKNTKKIFKMDKRLTGSHVIDEQLQEIIEFIIRDYVYPWYDQLSDSNDVPFEIRIAVQNVVVAFANRMKEADWIPFLTTQLVDDAATHLRLYRQARSRLVTSNTKITLEDAFFDLELAMENNKICRDHVCMKSSLQRYYLQQLTDVILFYLSPEVDFHCLGLRYITRELIVNSVLIPLLAKLSDPDYINQIIIWLCKDFPASSEVFMTVLKVTDNVDELLATKDILIKEISTLRSRDAGGDAENQVKQQLSSLNYLGKLLDTQIARLQAGDNIGPDYSKLLIGSPKLFQLPLDALLKNTAALNYFIDYMQSVGQQGYLFFHLNVEGWKLSTEQQLSGLEQSSFDKFEVLLAEQYSASKQTLEKVREAASSIFEQYLTENSSCRLQIDESVVKTLLNKIKNDKPNQNWFDEAQACVIDKMQNDESCLSGFRSSPGYVKLLSEQNLLQEIDVEGEDSASLDQVSLNSDTASLPEFVISPHSENEIGNSGGSPNSTDKPTGPFTLFAEIIETGFFHDKGKTFGVYAVSVTKKYESGHRENWHIYRRYSDFYELHQKIKEKFPELGKLSFPAKKTFGNMERKTLERRMIHLNNYLRSLCDPNVLVTKPGIMPILLTFLSPSAYPATQNFTKAKLDSVFRLSMQAMRSMKYDSMVDGVVVNLSKMFQIRTAAPVGKETKQETMKVSASLDIETADNIPMRILLLLMTEVFELKASSQWLRRRLVAMLRQLVSTMFGDKVNRRIVEYVSLLTSPGKVASYLASFKEAFWPFGMQGEQSLPRDHATKMRTRVAAKVSLVSSLSDDIKHILGSETTLTGLMSVFALLQVSRLNTRFWSVILEGAITNMFAGSHEAIIRLHAKSQRLEVTNTS